MNSADERRIRVATFNLQHGVPNTSYSRYAELSAAAKSFSDYDESGRAAVLQELATKLRELDLDVLLLQEVDARLPRSGMHVQAAELARLLQMQVVYFPAVRRNFASVQIQRFFQWISSSCKVCRKFCASETAFGAEKDSAGERGDADRKFCCWRKHSNLVRRCVGGDYVCRKNFAGKVRRARGEYGNAVLTRLPMMEAKSAQLTLPQQPDKFRRKAAKKSSFGKLGKRFFAWEYRRSEARVCGYVQLLAPDGKPLTVASTHLAAERQTAVKQLQAALGGFAKLPARGWELQSRWILGGDYNLQRSELACVKASLGVEDAIHVQDLAQLQSLVQTQNVALAEVSTQAQGVVREQSAALMQDSELTQDSMQGHDSAQTQALAQVQLLAAELTFPSHSPTKQIDFLHGCGLHPCVSGAIQMPVSDHRLLFAELALAPDGI